MPDVLEDPILPFRLRDVSAGQWSYQHPSDRVVIPPNAGTELQDIEIDRIGQRSKRRGYEIIANDTGDATAIHGLVGFSPASGSKFLMMETDGELFRWDGAAGSWTSVISGLTAVTDFTELFVAKNIMFRTSQTDNVRSTIDGTAIVDEGNTNTDFPLGKLAIYSSTQRAFVANTLANPELVFVSAAGDPQTYDRTTDALAVGKNDKDGVTGIIEFTNGQFIAFTKEQMDLININFASVSSFTQEKISDIGCEAPRSLRLIGEDALFLSRDGVRSILQSSQDKKRGASLPISFPIQDFIERINWTVAKKAVATVWQDKYYLSVPLDNETVNSAVLVWSRRAFAANGGKGGWTVWTNWKSNAYGVQDFDVKPRLYFGEATASSKVYEARSSNPEDDNKSDDGTAITFQEVSRQEDFGFPEADKLFQSIEVEALAEPDGIITIEAKIDSGDFTTVGTMNLNVGLPQLPIDLSFDLKGEARVRQKFDLQALGRGRAIQIRLTESTLDCDTTVLGITVNAFEENQDEVIT